VLALDQEDDSLDRTLALVERLGEIPFELATDLGRVRTQRYERVTTYLLDREGRVLEIFPSHPEAWMPWDAVLERIERERAVNGPR
jgi:hypothetical protein